MYDSTINFTLDTICPWTYLAKKRLDEALRQVRATDLASKNTNFTIVYQPYQLYPEATQEGQDKTEWYKSSRYGADNRWETYVKLMNAYGASAGIQYKFGGTIANTLQAHRIIQHFQEAKGPETADKLVNSLYRQYFEEERHPSSPETLLRACTDAGISEEEAKKVIDDEEEGLRETKMKIGEQRGNGVDSVPFVLIEGRKRDVSVTGANEVEDYVKQLMVIVKESA